MASSSYWRCLLRPSVSSTPIGTINASPKTSVLASFSTCASLSMPPKPAGPAKKGPQLRNKGNKPMKTLRIKKTAPVKTSRPPAPGERKAARKRIVLSNTNALEVEGMVELSEDSLLDDKHVGAMLGLPGTVVDQLRAVEAFKTNQGWSLFRRPAILVRSESIQIAQIMENAKQNRETAAYVVDGARSTGKSLMLIHAMAIAFVNKWIVVNIPEAFELTNAHTDYSPIPDTKLYSQNVHAAKWLGEIIKANGSVLSTFNLSQKHNLPIPLKDDLTILQLAELGAKDAEIAWPIFQAVWSEITAEGRPPILMAIDGLEHVMQESKYRSPEFELVHAHDLATIKLFMDYLGGSRKLANGGAIFAATTRSNSPKSYAIEAAMQQAHDRNAGSSITPIEPYKPMDQRGWHILQHPRLIRLGGLSKREARGLMEYWAASGVLRQRIDDQIITEKLALSGNGVIGEIQKNALWMRI